MSLLAASERERGRPIIANYPLACARLVSSWSQVIAFEAGVFAWDEAHVDADSRQFARNVEVTSWFLQTRKAGLDLYLTTQSFSQVDNRIRAMVDYLFLCEKVSGGGRRGTSYHCIDMARLRVVRSGVLVHSAQLYGLYDTKAKVRKLD
jgi:hypothetical protein